jgi:hypothetical protein
VGERQGDIRRRCRGATGLKRGSGGGSRSPERHSFALPEAELVDELRPLVHPLSSAVASTCSSTIGAEGMRLAAAESSRMSTWPTNAGQARQNGGPMKAGHSLPPRSLNCPAAAPSSRSSPSGSSSCRDRVSRARDAQDRSADARRRTRSRRRRSLDGFQTPADAITVFHRDGGLTSDDLAEIEAPRGQNDRVRTRSTPSSPRRRPTGPPVS